MAGASLLQPQACSTTTTLSFCCIPPLPSMSPESNCQKRFISVMSRANQNVIKSYTAIVRKKTGRRALWVSVYSLEPDSLGSKWGFHTCCVILGRLLNVLCSFMRWSVKCSHKETGGSGKNKVYIVFTGPRDRRQGSPRRATWRTH